MLEKLKASKPTIISYFIATVGVLVAGAIGSQIIGPEYSPLVFTTGGVFLEKLANLVKEKLGDKIK